MSEHTGLADRANFDAFSLKWRDLIMEEAGKWCDDPAVQKLLTEAVLTDFRRQYAHTEPSERMEYFIKAQTCLVFSETGRNPRRLKDYIAARDMGDVPAPPRAPAAPKPAAPKPAATRPAAPKPAPEPPVPAPPAEKAAVPEVPTFEVKPAGDTPPRPSSGLRVSRRRIRALRTPVNLDAIASAAEMMEPMMAAAQLGDPALDALEVMPGLEEDSFEELPGDEAMSAPFEPAPEEAPIPAPPPPGPARRPSSKPDTFYDPGRTAMWTPGSDAPTEHVVQEVVIPDDEPEEERSTGLSLLNTLLFIAMIASFAFLVYESRVIQHYFL